MQIHNANASFKAGYARRFERALIAALALAIILFYCGRSFIVKFEMPEVKTVVLEVQNIPQTRQGAQRPPPPKPTVPIVMEDDVIPDDETIEPTTLDLSTLPSSGEASGLSGGLEGGEVSQPKPVAFVFPQYPEEERKRGVRGEVRVSLEVNERGKVVSATVLENTTGSELCAQAAVKAALATRFLPAKGARGPVVSWVILPYRFDYRK